MELWVFSGGKSSRAKSQDLGKWCIKISSGQLLDSVTNRYPRQSENLSLSYRASLTSLKPSIVTPSGKPLRARILREREEKDMLCSNCIYGCTVVLSCFVLFCFGFDLGLVLFSVGVVFQVAGLVYLYTHGPFPHGLAGVLS